VEAGRLRVGLVEKPPAGLTPILLELIENKPAFGLTANTLGAKAIAGGLDGETSRRPRQTTS